MKDYEEIMILGYTCRAWFLVFLELVCNGSLKFLVR